MNDNEMSNVMIEAKNKLIELNNRLIEKNNQLIIYNEIVKDIVMCINNHKLELSAVPEGVSFLRELNNIFRRSIDKMK